MSAASRYLIEDTVRLSQNPEESYDILLNAPAAYHLLCGDADRRKKIIDRFITIVAGIRSHVIADTWAHQDWAGVQSDINTYWDNSDSWMTFAWESNYSIKYQCENTPDWFTVVLRSGRNYIGNSNLAGAPNIAGNLGHGWMGHLPDFSFVKYKYRPAWDANKTEYLRDNPVEYRYAFIELLNMFQRMNNTQNPFKDNTFGFVNNAIRSFMDIGNDSSPVRVFSAKAWIRHAKIPNALQIDVEKEPCQQAVLDGKVTKPNVVSGKTAYGTFALDLKTPKGNICDLYLFHIAADYHFHFVRDWLQRENIAKLEDGWSTAPGPLSLDGDLHDIITERLDAIRDSRKIVSAVKFGNDNKINGPVNLLN
ncbi:MAG: hypothetical protein HC887_10255 [Desulfobacteraceae bacterium]|nr:hypothetical protein [Desulfobacteraceae bacterium]